MCIRDRGADLDEVEKKIKLAKMPAEARKKAEGELKKLKLMSPMSAEATVVRNYIDVLVALPWSKKTKIKHDLGNAEQVLNEDHYGLDKVKDRILEYLAVQQRARHFSALRTDAVAIGVHPFCVGTTKDLPQPRKGREQRSRSFEEGGSPQRVVGEMQQCNNPDTPLIHKLAIVFFVLDDT